jgi:2-polyprenyl-6-methoxyphenol hydroxylase-like FAD-dependent oxidoreductase
MPILDHKRFASRASTVLGCRALLVDHPPSFSPVTIVGGGPVGLLLSNLLSYSYKVPSILLDAQTVDDRFRHPQAHFLNTRTMEILRHWLPVVYESTKLAMPAVDEWNSFRFVSSMSQTRPLAKVVHPVSRPLQMSQDANGALLMDDDEGIGCGGESNAGDSSNDLSVCSVGHLAQHTFCRILYDHACGMVQEGSSNARLLYGTRVTNVYASTSSDQDHEHVAVETDCGHRFSTDLVVAADGARSRIRQICGIQCSGQEAFQDLINIHVRLSIEQASRLHSQQDKTNRAAMLYSVFSPDVVAMVVCHSIGEYVIQIPYFPPYQSLEEDFSGKKLETILHAIFGPAVDNWELCSVRCWSMSSLIADQYFSDMGVALVGDAAHVFPPAGGFGMNTGLQDVHNLAWKVAWAFHNNRLKDRSVRACVLQSYQRDRRPVAQENAALSVRNYQRLLHVTKSLYLDDRHPVLLKAILDQSPLPFEMRQSVFRSLFKMALYPFSWIDDPESQYAKHVRRNLRRILRTGAGLPLLFPKFEIGFAYSAAGTMVEEGVASSVNDTLAHAPSLEVGGLLPHTEMLVSWGGRGYPGLKALPDRILLSISISDLPAQLSIGPRPAYVLLCVGGNPEEVTAATKTADAISKKNASPVEVVSVVQAPYTPSEVECLVLCEKAGQEDRFSFFANDRQRPYLVLIRPDGHIVFVHSNAKIAAENWADPLTKVAERILPVGGTHSDAFSFFYHK